LNLAQALDAQVQARNGFAIFAGLFKFLGLFPGPLEGAHRVVKLALIFGLPIAERAHRAEQRDKQEHGEHGAAAARGTILFGQQDFIELLLERADVLAVLHRAAVRVRGGRAVA
jgi:hypothetical protein